MTTLVHDFLQRYFRCTTLYTVFHIDILRVQPADLKTVHSFSFGYFACTMLYTVFYFLILRVQRSITIPQFPRSLPSSRSHRTLQPSPLSPRRETSRV